MLDIILYFWRLELGGGEFVCVCVQGRLVPISCAEVGGILVCLKDWD